MEWQQDGEGGQTRTTFEFDETVMTAHQILRDCQTEAGAVGATSDEWIKERVSQMLRYARAGILELDAGNQSVAACADVLIGQRARSKNDATAIGAILREGLRSVAAKVQHGLDDLVTIEKQRRQARIVIALHHNARRCVGSEQMSDVLQ